MRSLLANPTVRSARPVWFFVHACAVRFFFPKGSVSVTEVTGFLLPPQGTMHRSPPHLVALCIACRAFWTITRVDLVALLGRARGFMAKVGYVTAGLVKPRASRCMLVCCGSCWCCCCSYRSIYIYIYIRLLPLLLWLLLSNIYIYIYISHKHVYTSRHHIRVCHCWCPQWPTSPRVRCLNTWCHVSS